MVTYVSKRQQTLISDSDSSDCLFLKSRNVEDIQGCMDIIERFNVATAASSRDLAYYKELGGKIELNQRTKTHLPEPDFQPIFKHSIETALTALSKGFGETDELA